MSLIDSKLVFSDKQDLTGTDGTDGKESTNVLDLGLEENHLSGNIHGAGYLNVQFLETPVVAPTCGMTIQLLQADDLTDEFDAVATYSLSDPNTENVLVVRLPRALKRFVKLLFVPVFPVSEEEGEEEDPPVLTAGKVDAFIGAPLAEH